MYGLLYTNQAKKDYKKLKETPLLYKALELLELFKINPYQNPPPYEKLTGNMSGVISRRINIQHRLVYQIYEKEKEIKVLRLWSHYE